MNRFITLIPIAIAATLVAACGATSVKTTSDSTTPVASSQSASSGADSNLITPAQAAKDLASLGLTRTPPKPNVHETARFIGQDTLVAIFQTTAQAESAEKQSAASSQVQQAIQDGATLKQMRNAFVYSETNGAQIVAALSGSQAPQNATVGSSITLAGNANGEQAVVTVLKVNPNAAAQQYMSAPHGQKYVGVKISIKNSGQTVYNDSPSNGAAVVDTKNESFNAGFSESKLSPDIGGSLTIPPGETRVGWITFTVPKKARLKTFQFTLDSGFGPQAGEWTL